MPNYLSNALNLGYNNEVQKVLKPTNVTRTLSHDVEINKVIMNTHLKFTNQNGRSYQKKTLQRVAKVLFCHDPKMLFITMILTPISKYIRGPSLQILTESEVQLSNGEVKE